MVNAIAYSGEWGFKRLTGTESSTAGDEFIAIQAVADTVIDFDTVLRDDAHVRSETSVTALPIPAGVVIYGRFDNLVLTSGDVIAIFG